MRMRARRPARIRALIVTAASLATVAAWKPAAAAPPPPLSVQIEDGGDGWIGTAEAPAVTISGTYDLDATPGGTSIIARIVNSETCDETAAEATNEAEFSPADDGTFLSPPFDVSGFSDGAILCARARTENTDGQSDVVFSTNLPVLDLSPPGTPSIVTPLQNATVGAHPKISGTLPQPVHKETHIDVYDVTTLPVILVGSTTVDQSGGWTVNAFFQTGGTRHVRAQALDPAGNAGALSAARILEVDASAPTVTIEVPANNSIYLPGEPVLLEGQGEDRGFGILAIEVHVYNLGQTIETHQIKDFTCMLGCPTNLRVSWQYTPPNDIGYITVKIWAIDVAGNRSPQPAEVNYLKLV